MKKTHPPMLQSRFTGNLRHYHRTSAQTQKSWDFWVDGPPAPSQSFKGWPKIFGLISGGVAVTSVITGLLLQLR